MPNFSVHPVPVGNTVHWIEKMNVTFLMASTSSITMQSSGKIVQRAPAVVAKMWCLSVTVFLSVTLRVCYLLTYRAFEGCIVRTSIALPFVGRFRLRFQRFFSKVIALSEVRIFVARWRHNFREIAVRNCEKSKNRRKSLWAPLRIDS